MKNEPYVLDDRCIISEKINNMSPEELDSEIKRFETEMTEEQERMDKEGYTIEMRRQDAWEKFKIDHDFDFERSVLDREERMNKEGYIIEMPQDAWENIGQVKSKIKIAE